MDGETSQIPHHILDEIISFLEGEIIVSYVILVDESVVVRPIKAVFQSGSFFDKLRSEWFLKKRICKNFYQALVFWLRY